MSEKAIPAFLRGRNLNPDPEIVRQALATISEDTFEVNRVRTRGNNAGVACLAAFPGVTLMFPFLTKQLDDGTIALDTYDIATKLNGSVHAEIWAMLNDHREAITQYLDAAIRKGLD